MSISATESTGAAAPSTGFSLGTTSSTEAQEDKQMFLELMVAQLRFQDPLNPTDSGQFLAQSAQFTALEKMQDVADRTGALLGAQMAFGASALVGKNVTWTDASGETLSGSIDSVTFGVDGPMFDIDGTEVPLANIVSVTSQPDAGTAPTDTSSDTSSDDTDPASGTTSA